LWDRRASGLRKGGGELGPDLTALVAIGVVAQFGAKHFDEFVNSKSPTRRLPLLNGYRSSSRAGNKEMQGIPMKMKAVLLNGDGRFEQLEYRVDVPVPAFRAGEVLVPVQAVIRRLG
jgi:hypothetical protein